MGGGGGGVGERCGVREDADANMQNTYMKINKTTYRIQHILTFYCELCSILAQEHG